MKAGIAEHMKTNPPPAQPLRRLMWTILLVSILVITLIQGYLILKPGNWMDNLAVWLVGVPAVVALVLLTFREAERLQGRLDQQLADSRLQLQRQAVLVQLSLKLTPTLDETQICHLVTNELRHAMGYDQVDLVLVEKNTPVERLAPISPHYNPTRLEFPLQVGGEMLGTLLVENKDSSGFGSLDNSFLSAVANQAALAIVNSRLLERQRKQRVDAEVREAELRVQQRSMHLLSEITQSALRSPDLASMLQTFAENLGQLFEANWASLALWDEARQSPELVSVYSQNSQRNHLQIAPKELGLVEAALSSGQPLIVKDASASPYISPHLRAQLDVLSLLTLPLITSSQKLGAAIIAFKDRHNFSQNEVSLGEQAARQIALAISKARALQAAQVRAQELDALQRATSALLTTLEQEDLLGQILDAAISAIPAAQQGSLHLIARESGQLQVRAVQGHTDPRIRAIILSASNSHIQEALREHKPLLIQDAYSRPGSPASPEDLETAAYASTIIAPLVLGDQALGAISLDSSQREAFTQADLDLLVSFAATATTAIQNSQLHAEVQKQAITDTLTGYYNRRGFNELGRREVERAIRFNRPLSALMLDIDLFKQVNDIHGHLIGDRVLVGMTSRIAQELRQIDLLGRYGGDEFIMLLPETSQENAWHVAERLRTTIAAIPFRMEDKPLKITISIGIAALCDECKTLESLVEKADDALYLAKEKGRNCVVVL
jgi:diguanylate cyclase (GGDEF)-like protein